MCKAYEIISAVQISIRTSSNAPAKYNIYIHMILFGDQHTQSNKNPLRVQNIMLLMKSSSACNEMIYWLYSS